MHPAAEAETTTAPHGPSKPAAAGPARRRSSRLASKTDAAETTTAPRGPSKPVAAGPARRRSSRLASKTDAEETTTAPRGPSKPVAAGPAWRTSSRLASKTDAEETTTAPRGPSKPAAAGPARRTSSGLASKTDAEETTTAPRGPSKPAAAGPARRRSSRLAAASSKTTTPLSADTEEPVLQVPRSLRKEVGPALRAAAAVEPLRPRVAYLCRLYASERADRKDQDSAGPGVPHFKTALSKRLEKGREGFKKATDAVRENGGGVVLTGLGLQLVAPTVITDIPADLLCEIFLLLPSLPSLVRAALACRTFLHAVQSCPTFLHRFQGLHLPQIIGFVSLDSIACPTFTPLRSRSDPDLTAAVRGSDFFLTRLPQDSGDSDLGWVISNCHGGYFVVVNQTTSQIAAYNPLTQALEIFPMPPEEMLLLHSVFEVHILISEEDQRVVGMVLVQQLKQQVPISVAVFSSATWEWQVLPKPLDDGAPPTPPGLEEVPTFHRGSQLNGFIYWKHASQAYLLALNTATLEFYRMDLPESMKWIDEKVYGLGQTKDGNLCVVGADIPHPYYGILSAWVWRAGDDGVEEWMEDGYFNLHSFIDGTEMNAKVCVEAIVDGFVYLCVESEDQPESLLSLCLKTKKLKRLVDGTYKSPALLYIMTWPPSLRCNNLMQRTVAGH